MTNQRHRHANAPEGKLHGARRSRARRIGICGGALSAAVWALTAVGPVAHAATPSSQAAHQGFRVKHNYVPNGYVLQGASRSSLDVAERGDDTPLHNFRRKLVVTLDTHGTTAGQPVRVGEHPGRYRRDRYGTAFLTYRDGGRHVVIQKWQNIHLTQSQLIHFAEGVVVTKYASVSHG